MGILINGRDFLIISDRNMSEELFKRYKIKAKKALGQNFLVNEGIIEGIANVIDVEDKNIIEVWPWYGALTQKLLEKNLESLTLVELDSRMVEILEDRIKRGELKAENTNFKIENTDVLKYLPLQRGARGGELSYCVIANIPYYITSPILRHFLYNLEQSPEQMVILMQRDVGDKILSKKSSVISLIMTKKCSISEVLQVGKQNFIPAPRVESSVLLFERQNKYDEIDDEQFLKYIKMWFAAARKKLIKNFINWWLEKEDILTIFKKLEIDEKVRWDALNISQWCKLVNELSAIS